MNWIGVNKRIEFRKHRIGICAELLVSSRNRADFEHTLTDQWSDPSI